MTDAIKTAVANLIAAVVAASIKTCYADRNSKTADVSLKIQRIKAIREALTPLGTLVHNMSGLVPVKHMMDEWQAIPVDVQEILLDSEFFMQRWTEGMVKREVESRG